MGCGIGRYLERQRRVCVECPPGLVNLLNLTAEDVRVCVECGSPTAYVAGLICVEARLGAMPNENRTNQTQCPPGTSRNSNQTTCTACQPGHFAAEGLENCLPCGSGYFAGGVGLTKCSSCPLGQISTEQANAACSPCAPGTYASGGMMCVQCLNNSFSPLRGASVCERCNPPEYSHAGATACSACPNWTVFDLGVRGCSVCAPGTYMVSRPSFRCVSCPVGTFLPFGGSKNSSDCRPCGNGTVAPVAGASRCAPCTPGNTAKSTIACRPCEVGTYNSDGMLCVQCASGTYSDTQGVSSCAVCAPGTFQNATMGGSTCALCPAGKISDGSTGKECLSCLGWSGTFAPSAGQTICTPRTKQCSLYHYYNVTRGDPTADNVCVRCAPCAPDQLVLGDESVVGKLGLLSPGDSKSYLNQLCPGNTPAPLYTCIDNSPVPGRYLAITQAVGAAGSLGSDPYAFQPCTDTLYDSSQVLWAAGPDIQTCYVSCLYGVSLQGIQQYIAAFQKVDTPYAEDPLHNIFLQRMLPYRPSVCLPCPQSQCELGRFRPNYAAGCGPPCALHSFVPLCASAPNTGCVGLCSNSPPNAGYVGGAVGGSQLCPWGCLPGWHLADNGSSCLPCDLPPALLCNSQDYAVLPPPQCLPWHTSQDLCKYCSPRPFATLVGWNITCQYKCYKGYFYLNGTCTHCRSVWLTAALACPVGMYLDESLCYSQGEAPSCRPCDYVQGLTFVSNGGLNASQCKASCLPGFHTVSKSSGAYATRDLFPTVRDALCVKCLPSDTRSCNFSTPCFPGYFRNMSVADGQPLSCVPCRTSRQCPAATYALRCLGSNTTDAPCLPCSPSLLLNQKFVGNSLAPSTTTVTQGDCPRVCLNNHVQAQENPLICVPCRTTTAECPAAGVQPPSCAFIYSHWNATPGVAWWDAQHAPPGIAPYSSTKAVRRAGVCWACPVGTATLEGSEDLCITLPGYSSAVEGLPTAKIPIPTLPADIYFAMQTPRLPTLAFKPRGGGQRRRALLSTTTSTAVAQKCPFGAYKPSSGGGICFVCPSGSSTVGEGSAALSDCMCLFGYRLAKSGGPCQPCPQDTFSTNTVPITQASSTQCTPCPANTSTLGTVGATSCACALGYVALQDVGCSLCPAGYYCPPCTTAQATCPVADMRECFPGSTSPAGSYSVSNCSCGEGLVLASRPRDKAQLYCRSLPLGAVADPFTGLVSCLPGWTPVGEECQLCPPGQFATVDSNQQLLRSIGSSRPYCTRCPLHTYNPTASAVGGCTPCPPQQITSKEGTAALENCSCPGNTIPVKGGCVGCLPNQYSLQDRCMNCPPNSLAQAAASRLADCLCLPGFQPSAGACEMCPQGFYSTHASNAPCPACPKGSTTGGAGATRLSACGETPALCLKGYAWRRGVGCFLS